MDFILPKRSGLVGLFLFLAGVMLWTVQDYGITSDEPGHVEYGEAILKWYASGFQDQTVFESKNTWLYGGLFDTTVAIASRILPFDTYSVRHFCNALVGLFGLIAAYRIGALLGGPRAGLIAALFLVFTPRYYGHAFNNPKDIPFAVGYLWGIYYLLRCLTANPNLPRHLVIQTGLAFGATLAIRVGGLLLFLYAGVFLFIAWIQTPDRSRSGLGHLIGKIATAGLIAYGVAIIFWPWLQVHPITGIYQAFQTFGSFPEIHYTFFESIYIGSDETPWYYAPKWLLLTLPEFVLLGLLAGAALILHRRRLRVSPQYGLLIFSALFPISYAIFTQMPLYDGIRHLLFVIPPLAILAALSVDQLLNFRTGISNVTFGVCVVLLLLTLRDLIVLHPNQYVYFNRLFAGGTAEASLHYDTDYWENSYRSGLKWIEQHAPASHAKPKIRAHYAHAQLMLDANRFTWVHLPDEADYYLANTRYERHKLIAGEILHTVQADGANLLYIVRPDSAFARDPFFLNAPYKFAYLGEFYEDLDDPRRALMAYAMAVDQRVDTLVTPRRMWGYFRAIALLFMESGGLQEAREVIQKAIQFDPNQAEAWSLMAQIHIASGNLNAAHAATQKALEIHPDSQTDQMRYIHLGALYQQQGQNEKALSIYQTALQWQPNDADVLVNQAVALYTLGRFEESIAAFKHAVIYKPDDIEIQLGLALVYEKNRQPQQAVQLYRQILQQNPGNAEAKNALMRIP